MGHSAAATSSEPSAASGLDIAAVKVATAAPLPVPVAFGNWVMRHREFALCGVVAADGMVDMSFCYTRDGPIRELVHRLVRPHYEGSAGERPMNADDPDGLIGDL